jgi:hypothetical protein
MQQSVAERALQLGLKAEWLAGECPCCGELMVSNVYRLREGVYVRLAECWRRIDGSRACDYCEEVQ